MDVAADSQGGDGDSGTYSCYKYVAPEGVELLSLSDSQLDNIKPSQVRNYHQNPSKETKERGKGLTEGLCVGA